MRIYIFSRIHKENLAEVNSSACGHSLAQLLKYSTGFQRSKLVVNNGNYGNISEEIATIISYSQWATLLEGNHCELFPNIKAV